MSCGDVGWSLGSLYDLIWILLYLFLRFDGWKFWGKERHPIRWMKCLQKKLIFYVVLYVVLYEMMLYVSGVEAWIVILKILYIKNYQYHFILWWCWLESGILMVICVNFVLAVWGMGSHPIRWIKCLRKKLIFYLVLNVVLYEMLYVSGVEAR